MKKILLINGPNLNLIGEREVNIYGKISIENIKERCIDEGKKLDLNIDFRQTNSEGEIINWIHEVKESFDGLIKCCKLRLFLKLLVSTIKLIVIYLHQ